MGGGDFTLHRIKGYISIIYLVEYQHGMLLLDCGVRGDVQRIAEFCQNQLQRPMTDIKLAVASHYHPDHGGGAHLLREQYGITLAAHPVIDQWYSGVGGFIQHKLDSYMAQTLAKAAQIPREKLNYPRTMKPDLLLLDGSTLPGFEDWQVLWTPGHTACDICVYHQASGTLCIFDMINCVKGYYHLPLPVLMHEEMAASFDRLSTIPTKQVLIAHGADAALQMQPEDFIAMRDKLWLPTAPLSRYAYRMTWSSTFWRHYRKQKKAEGKAVLPPGFWRMD